MAFAVLPQHRPLTEDDLALLPDDGLRYELVHGEVLVSASPVGPHQRVSMNLALLLSDVVPTGYEVMPAPFDWRVNQFNVYVPDLMVVRHEDAERRRLETPPLLAVEILSPSTRQRDLHLKRRSYEDAGLGWYWIVDPDEPSLTVFRLVDGRFVEEASVFGEETYRSTDPVTVNLVPVELVRPHRSGGS